MNTLQNEVCGGPREPGPIHGSSPAPDTVLGGDRPKPSESPARPPSETPSRPPAERPAPPREPAPIDPPKPPRVEPPKGPPQPSRPNPKALGTAVGTETPAR